MTDELKPCPFCGEPVEFNKYAERVVCEDCGATIYLDYWQTRPLENTLRSQLAARDALIERLVDCGDAMHKMLNAGAVNLESDVDDAQWEWDNIVCEYRASKDGGGND